MKATPKRSNEPVVWLLFGAGGTISAIAFPVLVLIVGFLLPFNLIDVNSLYKIVYFVQSWFGKLILLALLIFPMWCGLHRIHHGLHDLKIHLPMSGFIFYGLATLYTILAFFAVLI